MRRAEKALLAVAQAAHVEAVSTCKVEDPLRALGLIGTDKSQMLPHLQKTQRGC
jgi:hypothetical protein